VFSGIRGVTSSDEWRWLRGFGITSELKVRPPKKKEKVIGAAALRGIEVPQFLRK
jgi:hypothetical protein